LPVTAHSRNAMQAAPRWQIDHLEQIGVFPLRLDI
jgi:hypothetical protein